MTIHYTIRYKNYANAPKATEASLALNRMYAWPMYGCILMFDSFVALCIQFFALHDEESPLFLALTALLFGGTVFLRLRKKKIKEAQIDADATRESLMVRDMTAEEFAEYKAKLAQEQKKRAMRIVGIVFAVLIGFPAFGILLSYIY